MDKLIIYYIIQKKILHVAKSELLMKHTFQKPFCSDFSEVHLSQLSFFQRSHCRTCSAAVCVTCHVVVNNAIKVIYFIINPY